MKPSVFRFLFITISLVMLILGMTFALHELLAAIPKTKAFELLQLGVLCTITVVIVFMLGMVRGEIHVIKDLIRDRFDD